jgi:hypothetical protein
MRNDFLDLRRQAKRITADPIVATDAKKAHAKKATATAKSSAKAEVTLTQILDTAPSLRSGQKQAGPQRLDELRECLPNKIHLDMGLC